MITFRKFVCMCVCVFVPEHTCLCMHACMCMCMCDAGEQIQDLMHTKHALYP